MAFCFDFRQKMVYETAMIDLFTQYESVFIWLSFLSLVVFLGSLAALPWLVGRLPSGYFLNPAANRAGAGKRQTHILVLCLRNGLGAAVFLMGIVMLFIPGQGILTMVAGLVIMEFPGKSSAILYFVRFEKVRRGLNWLRRKKGKPSLKFPADKW